MSEVREGYKMTELGEIPSEWKVVRLGELANIHRGASPRPIKDPKWFSSKSSHGWIRISDVTKSKKYLYETEQYLSNEGIAKSRTVAPEDLIMSICGTIGRPIILKINACIHDGFVAFESLKKDVVDTEFLRYYLLILTEYFKSQGQPGTQVNLNTSIVENALIALPILNEQQKIASILSTVDEQIDETEQLIVKTKELKKGLMQQLLTKGIGHTEFKQTELGEIPISWEILKFSACCSIVSGLVDPNNKEYAEYPHIGNANIEKMSGKLLDYKLVKDENLISGKFLFDERHVLYGKINPQFGKATYPEFKGLCSADMYPIEPKKEVLIAKYLLYSILDERFTKSMTANSARTGIPKVNKQEMDSYEFVVPPLDEQQKIASILSTVDKQIEIYEQEKAKYEELKKGLMQQLLTGQIRVKI